MLRILLFIVFLPFRVVRWTMLIFFGYVLLTMNQGDAQSGRVEPSKSGYSVDWVQKR